MCSVTVTPLSNVIPQVSGVTAQILYCRMVDEADAKIPLHVRHLVMNKYKFITVKSADTDVVVLLTSFMPEYISHHAKIQSIP